MVRSILVACGAAAVLLSACISDSPAGGSSASSSSSSGSTSSSSGGTDAGAASLFTNSGFEIGGCASWQAGNAVKSDEPSAYAGKLACLVCWDKNQGQHIYGVSQRVSTDKLKAGVVYRASAWVRSPLTGPAAKELYAAFAIDGGDDYTEKDDVASGQTKDAKPLTSDYHQIFSEGIPYEAKPGATSLFIEFLNRGDDDGCFVIDDAVLTAQ